MSGTDPWHASYPNVIGFAGILVRADWLDSADDVIYYLEKPWKWNNEYELWDGCGRPDLDDEGWDFFLKKLEKLA